MEHDISFGEINVEIKRYVWDVVDSNSWLMREGNEGLLIDVIDSHELYEDIKKLDNLTIIITHSHFDHICGLNTVRQLNKSVCVISTDLCSEYMGNIYRNMSATVQAFLAFYQNGDHRTENVAEFICAPSNRVFSEALDFDWCAHKVSLFSVYGHSKDGLVALVDDRWLFSGDTLLPMPTITRFPKGSTEKFWRHDIPAIAGMKDIELVFPGHGDSGDLFDMIRINKQPERYQHA